MAMSLQNAVASGNAIHQERLILKSGNFVAPADGIYLVTAIGPGGSGALAPASGSGLCATGGAAGGKAEKKVQLTKGQELAIVIGAGGAKCTVPGTNGNDGGTTTVTGPAIALTANGGKGGRTRAAGAGTAAGAIGGTATGGDVNLQGGNSGSATVVATVGCSALTGGGAVAIYEKGYASGDALVTGDGLTAYTAGAGVGGQSGNATSTVASPKAISEPGSSLRGSSDVIDIDRSPFPTGTDPESAFGFDGLISNYSTSSPQLRVLAPKSSGMVTNGTAAVSGCGSRIIIGSSVARSGFFAGAGPRDSTDANARNRSVCGGGTGGSSSGFADDAGSGCVVIEWFEGF